MGEPASTVAKALAGIHFPADRDKVVSHARAHGASPEVIHLLHDLPAETYTSMADVLVGASIAKKGGASPPRPTSEAVAPEVASPQPTSPAAPLRAEPTVMSPETEPSRRRAHWWARLRQRLGLQR